MKLPATTEVFSSLFESWGPSVRRYAYHLVHSAEVADDLVQEAFMALYCSLRDGPNIENPKGWMVRVVRNLAANYHRDEKRHSVVLRSREVRDLLSAVRGSPEEMFGEVKDSTRLFSVLSRREEEVLRLRLQSLKYREIGASAGMSAKSVATLLARALLKLRKATATHPSEWGSARRESNVHSRHYRAAISEKRVSTPQPQTDHVCSVSREARRKFRDEP